MLARTAASLLGLGVLVSGSAFGQEPSRGLLPALWGKRAPQTDAQRPTADATATSAPGKTLYFSKEAASETPIVDAPTVPAIPPSLPAPVVAPTKPIPVPAAVIVPHQPIAKPVVAAPMPVAPPQSIAKPAVAAPIAVAPPQPIAQPVVAAPIPVAPRPVVAAPIPSRPLPPPPPLFSGLQRTAMQAAKETSGGLPGEAGDYAVPLAPPGSQRLFRLESESSLQERMRQEALQRPDPKHIEFPPEPDISEGKPFEARVWKPLGEVVEPAYVCYGRLLFEDRNAERYGWDLGFIQPFVSASIFIKDTVLIPYHVATTPCCDCNSGYCLPGDPTPYLLYPPGLSVTGVVAEAAVIVGIAAMFP